MALMLHVIVHAELRAHGPPHAIVSIVCHRPPL